MINIREYRDCLTPHTHDQFFLSLTKTQYSRPNLNLFALKGLSIIRESLKVEAKRLIFIVLIIICLVGYCETVRALSY